MDVTGTLVADEIAVPEVLENLLTGDDLVVGGADGRERSLAVGEGVDFELLLLQGVADCVQHGWVVVGDEDPGHGPGSSTAGRTTRAVVPPPTRGPISTSPPSAPTASRTIVNPMPRPSSSGDSRRASSRLISSASAGSSP